MNSKKKHELVSDTEFVQQPMSGDTTDRPSYFEMEKIKETPFNVVSLEEGKWFGVMGQERLTEIVDSKDEAIKLVSELSWKNIINVIMILNNYGK